MHDTRHIGKILRARRKELGLTLEDVAELCDMSIKGYAKIELGDSDPKWSTLMKVFAVLKMDLGDLSVCVRLNVPV